MKKAYLLLAAAAIAIAGCDKVKSLTDINKNFEYKETVVMPELPGGIDTIPPGVGVRASFPGQGFPTNSKEYLGENNTNATLVTHVKLTNLSTTMQEPANGNFDFVDTLEIFLSAPGLAEQLVAFKYGIPKGQTKVDLDVKDLNLKEYFLKDSMFLRFGGNFVGVPDSNAKVELKSTFNLLANPLNKE